MAESRTIHCCKKPFPATSTKRKVLFYSELNYFTFCKILNCAGSKDKCVFLCFIVFALHHLLGKDCHILRWSCNSGITLTNGGFKVKVTSNLEHELPFRGVQSEVPNLTTIFSLRYISLTGHFNHLDTKLDKRCLKYNLFGFSDALLAEQNSRTKCGGSKIY